MSSSSSGVVHEGPAFVDHELLLCAGHSGETAATGPPDASATGPPAVATGRAALGTGARAAASAAAVATRCAPF